MSKTRHEFLSTLSLSALLAASSGLVGCANDPNSGPNSIISGINPLSWGNILTGQVGSPGVAHETVSLNDSVTQLSYFSSGLGLSGLNQTLPETIRVNEFDTYRADLPTFVFYVMGPSLDMLGAGGLMSASFGKILELPTALQSANVNLSGLVAAIHSTDGANVLSGIIDLALAVAGAGAVVASVLAAGETAGVPAAVLAALAVAGKIATLVFAPVAFTKLLTSLSELPNLGRFDLKVRQPRYQVTALEHQSVLKAAVNKNGHVLYETTDLTGGTGTSALWLRLGSTTLPIFESNSSGVGYCVSTRPQRPTPSVFRLFYQPRHHRFGFCRECLRGATD